MILYHGTSKSRGLSILKDKQIKINVARVYGENHTILPSNPNFVYLTRQLHTAVYYGKNAVELYEENSEIYIFKIEINNPNELLADQDELDKEKFWGNYQGDVDDSDYQESLNRCGCVRIGRDLNLDEIEVTHYLSIPYSKASIYSSIISDKMSNSQVEEVFKQNNLQWVKI
ncbi:hypothetical protein COJ85_32055 [Bacillus sp. AFS076308]|uniref:hypothetical protein n=1 Tax=unclassified Bacillus (in: firmicutes) TaxID=185979 RepID=UPI000BF4C824|nr:MULTISPECIES: hypothetical protein [unclassified Bacillus (in: firmicutes)]PFN77604.1 hypothetical protein COJ85_32055 [Bacillus sp. AFS076308]PGV45315.1 hypothetical protein COD92_30865 [Bacillus sp. AFS037270]